MSLRTWISALRHQTRQLYSNLLPIPCSLCGQTSDTLICDYCQVSLPLIGTACTRCALPLNHGEICGACLKTPPPFDQAWSLFRYDGDIRRCISQFKYQQRHQLSLWFAERMREQLTQRDQLPDCLVPIPLHPFKLRQRGYNQAALVADYLGKQLSIPVNKHSLKRVKYTDSQSQLDFKERRRNIRGAFTVTDKTLPKHIALLDDVMTSGNTAIEATKTLRRSQVQTIEVWTIARAISHH